MKIRNPGKADYPAISKLVTDAFGRPDEVQLVVTLRENDDTAIELVAELGGAIVGHVLLSKLVAPDECLALAPLSVSPRHQCQGIGGALIKAAIARARNDDWSAVFVLGEPTYYSRFGFDTAIAARFESEYPAEYFMALELWDGALKQIREPVIYAPPFSALD